MLSTMNILIGSIAGIILLKLILLKANIDTLIIAYVLHKLNN